MIVMMMGMMIALMMMMIDHRHGARPGLERRTPRQT
jgi:hypothetical protein